VNAKQKRSFGVELRRLLAVYRERRESSTLYSVRGKLVPDETQQGLSWVAVKMAEIIDRLDGKVP
jgi:hypothetical protein